MWLRQISVRLLLAIGIVFAGGLAQAQQSGWTVALGEGPREAALSYIEENWTDMRPKSLRDQSATRAG